VKFFEPGNADDLAAAMLAMINDQPLRDRLAAAGAAFAHQNRWDIKKEVYLNLVDGLCGRIEQGPDVGGLRSEVGDQRSEIGGRRSEAG